MERKPYGPFPYTPISQRPKLTWPSGACVALWVIVNIEVFPLDYGMPGDQNERPDPNARNPDVRQWARRDYGNRVGVWRIMDVLSKHRVRGTVALNSNVCDLHPQIIEAATKLGWELMGHCQNNSQRLTEVAPERERQVIHDTLARIQQAAGKKPVGWLGAGLQETWDTLDYLAEEDCLYVADWGLNDEQPYLMNINGKRLVALPYSWEINDSPAFANQKYTPGEFEQMIRRQFDVLYREGKDSGRVMAIALHPYLIGVPHRISALDFALDYICQHEGVWKATGEEIVRYYLDSCETF